MENKKILIAENNTDVSDTLKSYLMRAGHHVSQAFDGTQAEDSLRSINPDLLIYDSTLPFADGHKICTLARSVHPVPIIIISPKVGEREKMRLAEFGADEYVSKPISYKNIVSRVDVLLTRYYDFNNSSSGLREYGNITIDSITREIKVDGKNIFLTPKEFKILDYLALHAGVAIKKQKIMDEVWGYDEYIDENTLAVTVGRLRSKLNKAGLHCVSTVWGVGYKFSN